VYVSQRVIVDPQGQFVFSQLPPGSFVITARKAGYLDGTYGKARPDGAGTSLVLADAEHLIGVAVKMWRFATITGFVTDDVGDPVSGATVQVWKRAVVAGRWRLVYTGRTGSTDERGVYRVIGLSPGEYAAVITSFSNTIPNSLLVAANASKSLEGEALATFRRTTATNGTSGVVNDLLQGFPAIRVGDMMLQASGSSAAPTTGDDRSVNIYPTAWYPGAPLPAQAGIIKLGSGENRTGVDIQMTLVAAKRISGIVTGPDGPVPYLSMRLVPAGLDDVAAELSTSLSASFNVAMTSTDAAGAFTFLAVPPGQYVIRALTTPPAIPDPPAPTTVIRTGDGMDRTVSAGPALPAMLSRDPSLWTATPVVVGDRDTAGVVVTMSAGLHLVGRVEFDGAAERPAGQNLRRIRLSLQQADGRTIWGPNSSAVQVAPDGTLYSSGVPAGTYFLRADSAPAGWTPKSAVINGRDVLDAGVTLSDRDLSGLVLTFTDRPSRFSGVARDSQSKPALDATVLIFPSDGAWTSAGAVARRFGECRVSRSGEFAFAGLPAGAYDVVAIGDDLVTNWQDPAFLRRLSAVATHVTLGDGQSLTMDLTMAVIR
jgi:hypothetical protein